METHNLMNAAAHFAKFTKEIHTASTVAERSGNQFAVYMVESLLEEAEKVQVKLARVIDAAILTGKNTEGRNST